MKHFYGNPELGTLRINGGRFVAFAIGAESDFSELSLDDHLLAAGRVLPLVTDQPKVDFVSGPRVSDAASSARAVRSYTAHVIAFECWSEVFNPGPRPPHTFHKLVTGDTNAIAATSNFLVLPFAGRRHAQIYVTPLNVARVNVAVYGVKWASNDTDAATFGADPGDPVASMVPLAGTWAAPLTTSEPSADLGGPGAAVSKLGYSFHVGGTDSIELYDELVVYFGRPAGDAGEACDYKCTVVVDGEAGCA